MMTAGPFGGPMPNNDVPMGARMGPGNDVGMGRPPPSQVQHNNPQFGGGSGNGNYANGIPPPNRDQPPNPGRLIDLRVILSRDEVAFLFGFDGNLINQLRQQTGAHIQITEGESFEYVLLIRGAIDIIFKAFSLVCRKLWDLLTNIAGPGHNRPLKIRIAVPAVQCGSIIGKAGAKVKEIRDLTGAQIQVSHEPLPNSTERCVEISGSGESCLQCTYHICCVMQDSPLRGDVVPYVPPVNNPPPQMMPAPGMDSWRPVFLCGDKAFIIDGPLARPAPPELLRRELAKTPLGGDVAESLANKTMPDHMNPLTLMAAISKAQQNGGQPQPQTSREMTVNSEMINIMMAQSQGQKIDEIRRMSGAQVHISDQVQNGSERLVTLSGTEESILLAQFLIQSNVDIIVKERANNVKHQLPPPPSQNQQQMQQSIHQNSLHPTNQFDPSIMQQNPHHQPPPFQQQEQAYNNRGPPGGPPRGPFGDPHGGPGGPPGGNFRNNSGERFPPPSRGGRGRRSPPGSDRRGGGRRGRR